MVRSLADRTFQLRSLNVMQAEARAEVAAQRDALASQFNQNATAALGDAQATADNMIDAGAAAGYVGSNSTI